MSGSELTFVLCIENNAIRPQALLLCESIRRFGGCHREAPILAVAPRPGLGVDRATAERLRAMAVEYVERPLNQACPVYGSANRVYAAAWAEDHVDSEWIVVLDSDTLVLDELQLPNDADALVRPVDMKESASAGPGDPFEEYWSRLAALQGVSLDALPFVTTTVSGHRVRASYNGGLVAVRRARRILRTWAELFTASVEAGLAPWAGQNRNVYASTGHVGAAASEYWGSNQAALALSIWTTTDRVHHFPDTCNVPLHQLAIRPDLARPRSGPLVHVHYHWLFTEPHAAATLALLRTIGATDEQLTWVAERVPI
ncbi:MAG: hypothetical protein ABIX28_25730 [Vicinamibacterales bacterium]